MRPQSNRSVLDRLDSGARVAIVRLRSLGDCVLTTPAIDLLHSHRPDLRLAVVVEDRFRPVFEGNPAISDLLSPTLRELARLRAGLCLNLHGGTRSQYLTAASLAPIRAGFAHHSGAFLYNAPIPRAQSILGEERTVHTAEHLASAMFYLGVPRQEIPRARLCASRTVDANSYAVLHPFAATPAKTWPAERFIAIATLLQTHHGIEPRIIAGPGDDAAEFSAFRVDRLPLRQSIQIIAGASLFIGNDSGPAHIAAAFGVPVIAIFGPSDNRIWAPWRTESEVLKKDDIAQITVEQVAQATDRLRVAS
ncbi:MAG TPA: glycosyltransferase family 9 protein [Bryobacteraceae bacterium]|nr:glycosyltransferase family 9 protein [Bryobacteraceae bacterium]